MSRKIDPEIQEEVRSRADFLCEYCHTSERWQYVRFTFDHVIPSEDSSLENLALACFHCNRRKSNKTEGIDLETGSNVPFFNPRTQIWSEHFEWTADHLMILGKTAIGRATVEAFELNRARIILIRDADKEVHRHPPKTDLDQS